MCSISFITFINKTGLQHHLFHYSAWDRYQADKSLIILFFLFTLEQNRISYLHLGHENALSVETSHWKSNLIIQGYHHTALLKALGEDCLDFLILNAWFYWSLSNIYLCFLNWNIFTLMPYLIQQLQYWYGAARYCNFFLMTRQRICLHMWSWRANAPSHNDHCTLIYHIIWLFCKAGAIVFYLINNLPLIHYYWNVPIKI